MKSLFAVLMTVFFVYSLSACGDSTEGETAPAENVQDSSVVSDADDGDVLLLEDGASDAETQLGEETHEASEVSEAAPEELDEKEQLPSDPTEDPDQQASFYEFPAWHIP